MRLIFLPKRVMLFWATLAALLILVNLILTGGFFSVAGVFTGPKRDVPVYSVDTTEKKIAISFDATWGNDYTQQILDTLQSHHVKATFFLTGIWMRQFPADVRKIAAAGHEIGNHSDNHPHCASLDQTAFHQELMTTDAMIKSLTGKRAHLFRPPFGEYNNMVVSTVHQNGYEAVQWSIDSLDWQEVGVSSVVDRVLKNARPGAIILFHNNAKYTPQALPVILKDLQARGYKIVPVSDLLLKGKYIIDPNTGLQRRP